jgi:hypothetical protein
MATPLTDAITSLTAYANGITGKSDTNLPDAVRSLADGYGGGSSVQAVSGEFTGNNLNTINVQCDFRPDIVYVFAPDFPSNFSASRMIAWCLTDMMYAAIRWISDSKTVTGNSYPATSSNYPGINWSNGTLSLTTTNSTAFRYGSGITYKWVAIKYT